MAKVNWKKRDFSRQLRREQTDAELALWKLLRSSQLEGYKFRRQHVIGKYIVDFCCLDPKVVVELDGSQHMDHREYDAERMEFLIGMGFKVVRFWDNQVLKEQGGVIVEILRVLTAVPSSPPSPILRTGEGEV